MNQNVQDPSDATLAVSGDVLLPGDDADLQTVLAAWHAATVRLERTHVTLQEEVRRLTDELEAKNRELARKNRLADLGQMAAHVAHEVRNTLVPVSLYLSLLRRRLLGRRPESRRAAEDRIGIPGPGRDRQRPAPFHLGPRSALRALRGRQTCSTKSAIPFIRSWRRRRSRFARKVGGRAHGDGRSRHDPPRPAQPRAQRRGRHARGGRLELAAERDGASRRDWPSPTADPGSARRSCGRLFEPFVTTKPSGTGLGLTIVERIAEVHGGSVTAENAPGRGARFALRIPQPASEVNS